ATRPRTSPAPHPRRADGRAAVAGPGRTSSGRTGGRGARTPGGRARRRERAGRRRSRRREAPARARPEGARGCRGRAPCPSDVYASQVIPDSGVIAAFDRTFTSTVHHLYL